ncbi:MAG TPA: hypothetical protein VFQ61_16590, partial [Polyangiaceae bacterium]|nr:hypothetical protein [Polyangiaceae bacterium]
MARPNARPKARFSHFRRLLAANSVLALAVACDNTPDKAGSPTSDPPSTQQPPPSSNASGGAEAGGFGGRASGGEGAKQSGGDSSRGGGGEGAVSSCDMQVLMAKPENG